MGNKYVLKGIKKEQVMESVVRIFTDEASGKITRVEDRWNGNLPEGAVSDVSTAGDSSASSGGGGGQVRKGGGGWGPFALARWAVATGGMVAWWAFCEFSWWSPFLVGTIR